MVRSASAAALLGALLATAPAGRADAQATSILSARPSPERQADKRASTGPRLDFNRVQDEAFARPPDLFGIPLVEEPRSRERGFSFGVRPMKGVRAVAKLRF